jgi:hypothetical protein
MRSLVFLRKLLLYDITKINTDLKGKLISQLSSGTMGPHSNFTQN